MNTKAYEVVTDRLVAVIEKTGELPWRRPWRRGVSEGAGVNKVSGKPYRGVNAFMTALFTELGGYDSCEWVTYKQAKELGGSVKRGEKGLPVVYFNFLEKTVEGEPKRNSEKGSDVAVKVPFTRYSTVFNLSQCEGIEYSELGSSEPIYEHEPIEKAQSLLDGFYDTPVISHDVSNRAYYTPSKDVVNVPALCEFRTAEGYYQTTFHELIHATGHEKRLNRKTLMESHGFGSHNYSQEELVAELGACFLSSDCGIFDANIMDSAAYLKGWLRALKENPTWLVKSANAAQKAVDYLNGPVEEK